ncbi:MAG: hypothetical protein WA766_04670 [Candidatus Acidiferrales bacterium]|jgi:hypothetical protein
MPNDAFLSVWCRDFREELLPERFEQFLSTVPFSAAQAGFSNLAVRAVGPQEAPLFESVIGRFYQDPAEIVQLVRDNLNADSAYEARGYWDLWALNTTTGVWSLQPEPIEIRCYGEEYDDGIWKEYGHFQVDIGFELFFTGHARLLGFGSEPAAAATHHPDEANFLNLMTERESFRTYHERTRENIRKLLDWMQRIERTLPVDRALLWSEGEENFEARIEEILAVR